MTKVKRFNSTQPLANAKGGHWVKASDYDALAAKLAEVEGRIAYLENHIEAVAKDTHKIMLRHEEAALSAIEDRR